MNTITITGADERTDLRQLSRIQAEVGLLYTATPEGRNRYPSLPWIENAVRWVDRAAIHICGRQAREDLLSGKLDCALEKVKRIQINGFVPSPSLETFCALFGDFEIITQDNAKNEGLRREWEGNHAILVDASGGRGISPASWAIPKTENPDKRIGFAGGLGPHNMSEELEKIREVATSPFWVDMEGRIRDTDDWFSLELAEEAVRIFWDSEAP